MKETALKYFKEGYSCSESIVQAAIDKGYAPENLLSSATVFSGGMGVKCLCGALAGAQLVIGSIYGKVKDKNDGKQARVLAKKMSEAFSEKFKVNCCKVLSSGFNDFHSAERRAHCENMVGNSALMLENILKEEIAKVQEVK